MARDDYGVGRRRPSLEQDIADTVERRADKVPKTTKEKQASKRAKDMPPPSMETRQRGMPRWGAR